MNVLIKQMENIKKRTILFFQVFVALLFVCGLQCSFPVSSISISFSGHVFDKNTNLPIRNLPVKRFKENRSDNLFSSSTYDSIEEVKTDSLGYFAFQFKIEKEEYYRICAVLNDNLSILYCSSTNCPCFELSYNSAEQDPNMVWTFYVVNNGLN